MSFRTWPSQSPAGPPREAAETSASVANVLAGPVGLSKMDMIPAFEKLDRKTLERLVNKSLDELANQQF